MKNKYIKKLRTVALCLAVLTLLMSVGAATELITFKPATPKSVKLVPGSWSQLSTMESKINEYVKLGYSIQLVTDVNGGIIYTMVKY